MVSFYYNLHRYNHYNLHYLHCNLQNLLCHNLFLSDVGNVAVALHGSGSSSLNNDPSCTFLMENVLLHFCTCYYTVMFIFNRFLYSKFINA